MNRLSISLLLLVVLLLASVPAAAVPLADPQQPGTRDFGPGIAWTSNDTRAITDWAWGDYDGDGDLDLAGAFDDEPDEVWENNDGVPTLAWTSDASRDSEAVAWGDWDGDGDLDLAVAAGSGEANVVYENAASGLDRSPVWLSEETESTHHVAWADVDGDGDLDLASTGYNTPVRVHMNQGTGLETSASWSSTGQFRGEWVAWADWDRDGDPDLAVAVWDSEIIVFQNNSGQLEPVGLPGLTEGSNSVAWGDFDGDGFLDLVASVWDQPNAVHRNTGGALDPNPYWSTSETGDTKMVAWGNFNNKRGLDFSAADDGSGAKVYPSGNNDFLIPWVDSQSTAAHTVAWGDWDADGDLDLVVGNRDVHRLHENLNGPLGSGYYQTISEVGRAVAWGDWDGDGDLDLATAADDSNARPRVYENAGGILESLPAWLGSPHKVRDLAWGDVDGDLDLDLAVAREGYKNQLYLNTGGTLGESAAWESDEEDDSLSVAWGDWDNDGDLDLAVGNHWDPDRVYQNTGSLLQTSPAWSAAGEARTYGVAWGDWDDDGDVDLATGGTDVLVYENSGGALSQVWSSVDLGGATSVAWADHDGDGDMDLAVGRVGKANAIFENLGGAFGDPPETWLSVERDDTWNLAWGDWDGDGDLDLATGNTDERLQVYQNSGSSLSPAAVWTPESPSASRYVAWADVDRDGDLDLAWGGHEFGDTFCIAENQRIAAPSLPNNAPHALIYRPGSTHDADFYSSAEILTSALVPVWFRLFDAEGDRVARIEARYSTNGGGQWFPATVAGATEDLAASPNGTLHSLVWNALADGAAGDNIVFGLDIVYDNPTFIAFPIQRPSIGTSTFPFRLRPLAVVLAPGAQLGFGGTGETVTQTLTLVNRTGRQGTFALSLNSRKGWTVDGPVLVGPVADGASTSFVVSTTVPGPAPIGTLDQVTATVAALFNPKTFNDQAHVYTFKGAPNVSLKTTKQAPATAEPGETITYTLRVTNTGASPAGGVVASDTLPPGTGFAWAGQDGVYSPTLGAVLWPETVLLHKRSLSYTVGVTIHCAAGGTVISNDTYGATSHQTGSPVTGPAATTVVQYLPPQAAFAAGATELGFGQAITFANTSQQATAYLWDFGDGGASENPSPMHAWQQAGTFTVTLTASNLCGSDQANTTVHVRRHVYLPLVLR